MLFQAIKRYKNPLGLYVLFLVVVSLLPRLLSLSTNVAFSLATAYMLIVPIVFDREGNLFSFKPKAFMKGAGVSVVIILAYVLVYVLYGSYTGRSVRVRDLGYTFLFVQFFLVCLPEEAFFRGFLQREFGNNTSAILLVSVFFSIAHLVVMCIGDGGGAGICLQNALTFFPSLVMGYLYLWTETVWTSVFFHFLANVVYIQLVMN